MRGSGDAPGSADAARAADAPRSSDAPGSGDAPPLMCTSTSPNDNFAPGGMPCGTWGGPTQRGFAIARTASGLTITPTTLTSSGDFGGCTASNYDETQGTFVEVTSVLSGTTGYTNITAYVTTTAWLGMQVDSTGNLHTIMGSGSVPYDAATMVFWRIIPSGSDLVAQYSADAQTWTELGRQTFASSNFSSIYNVTFGAGRADNTGAGTATFAVFNLCP